jgi:glycosyltransferase involved in cell wall biosynthesis
MLERYVYNRVDAVVPVTLHLRNHILSYGVPESRVRVLPSGVDTGIFSPGPRNLDLLQQLGIGAGDPVVLFMGTVYKFSGLDRVIAEFPKVLTRHPLAKLLIVGCGEHEEHLKALTIQAGLSRNIIFAGLYPYSGLPDIIRASDVCINPFELNGITRDILPTKLFQYLACGKPVIATPLPGTLPFLSGEEHGIIYRSLDAFADTIGDLLDDPDRCDRLGRKGQEVTAANFEWRRLAETMVSWMTEMVH